MDHRPQAAPPRQRVVIVGAGFAGVHAARRLTRLAGRRVVVTLINPADYFLYLPLLPEVTAGILDPRRIAVSLRLLLTAGSVSKLLPVPGMARHPHGFRNIAASLGIGHARAYRHRGLGFVVDLAGAKAAADPLGVPLAGWPAKLVTRGYHLHSLPANRVRVAGDWALDAVLSRQSVQFGLVRGGAVPLSATGAGASRDLAAVSGDAA
jgi:NADH dehydrogenase FAD-containing subunit